MRDKRATTRRMGYMVGDGGPDPDRPGRRLIRLVLGGVEVMRVPAEEAEQVGLTLVKAGREGQGKR